MSILQYRHGVLSTLIAWYAALNSTITQTNKGYIALSLELSGKHEHDSNYFEPLVKTTAANFDMNEISADLVYSSREIYL